MQPNKQLRFDHLYMDNAHRYAQLSHCTRKQVGAIIVSPDGKNQIAFGYNGTPAGYDNCCECEDGVTKREVLHAETNAIGKVAVSTLSTQDCILYTTLSPCIDCAKLIVQVGIKEVVYATQYKDVQGLVLLRQCGVTVRHLNYTYVDHTHSIVTLPYSGNWYFRLRQNIFRYFKIARARG